MAAKRSNPRRKRGRQPGSGPLLPFETAKTGHFPPSRGEVLVTGPAAMKSAGELGVYIDAMGHTKRVLYEHDPKSPWDIRPKGVATIPKASTAARREQHKAENIANEYRKLVPVREKIEEIRHYLVKNGIPSDLTLRQRLKNKLVEQAAIIGPRSRNAKKTAFKQVMRAAEQVEGGNAPSIILSLFGARNNLSERISRLGIQRPRAARTYGAIREDMIQLRERYEEWLSRTRRDAELLQHDPQLSQRIEMATHYEHMSDFFQKRNKAERSIESEQLEKLFGGIAKLLRKGELTKVHSGLQRVWMWQWGVYARNFVIPPETLRLLPRWSEPGAVRVIVNHQTELVAENIVDWNRTGQGKKLLSWMEEMEKAIPALPIDTTAARIQLQRGYSRARELIHAQRFETAKTTLLSALKPEK